MTLKSDAAPESFDLLKRKIAYTRAYVPAFDGLRGIAVLSVVLRHFRVPGFYPGGDFGVDIFFVLSGFLITSILRRSIETGTPLYGFYWDRFTRLFFPLALVCLSLFLLPRAWLSLYGAELNALGALSYVTNWTRAIPVIGWPNFMAHTWSLSTEEQFYLIWPNLLFLIHAGFKARTGRAIFMLLGLCSIWFVILGCMPLRDGRLYNGLDGRLPGLLLGAALAYWKPPAVHQIIAAAALGAYFVMMALLSWTALTAPFAWLIATILISFARQNRSELILTRILSWPPLVFTGVISYELYLWHWPIYYGLVEQLHYDALVMLVPGAALSFALAYLTMLYVEMPARRLRDSVSPAMRQRLGRALAVWTFISIGGGLIFFYGGFLKVPPY